MAGVIAPLPSQNEADRAGVVSGPSIARLVLEQHSAALQARRKMELLWEMLLLHIDGSGDRQWAAILNDTKVEIPRFLSEFRKTENLLRAITDNAVAHHTSNPLIFGVQSTPDRRAQETALMDKLWANHLALDQDFNGLFMEAMYLAIPAGFCPVHAYWREDVDEEWYESVGYGAMQSEGDQMLEALGLFQPKPGMIDCWVGNPFATVFNSGAKRGSVRWCSYERLLNADAVREAFGHMPGVAGLEGSDKIPSSAEFQLIAQEWRMAGLGLHGDPVVTGGHRKGEELMTVICRETAPVNGDGGRLQMIAVPGKANTRAGRRSAGHAVLLADQPLPGGDWSWENVYSHHRGSDVHGKPWIEDIDQLQVDLNIAKSKLWEGINKGLEAPIVAPGGALSDDLAELGGYYLMEIEPSLASWRPQVMEYPAHPLQQLRHEVEDLRRSIYTLGGYQAASRGEAPGSRTAYRAIVALQQADNTIHGPVNARFKRSACNFMRKCWRQMKTYGDVGWFIEIAGDEHAHLVDTYIDKTKLSKTAPRFVLTNAFGTSMEARSQEILAAMTTRGADMQPFLRTDEARRIWPDQTIFDSAGDPSAVQRRRARTIAAKAHDIARDYRSETGFDETQIPAQWRQQALQQAGFEIAFGKYGPMGELLVEGLEQLYPRLADDDLMAHLAAYAEVTQDETADPLARAAIRHRQALYFQWQAQMAAGMGAPLNTKPQQPPPQQGNGSGEKMGDEPDSIEPRAIAAAGGGRRAAEMEQ